MPRTLKRRDPFAELGELEVEDDPLTICGEQEERSPAPQGTQ